LRDKVIAGRSYEGNRGARTFISTVIDVVWEPEKNMAAEAQDLQFSARELQVLDALRSGFTTSSDVAQALRLKPRAVKKDITNILRAKGLKNRRELFATLSSEKRALPDVLTERMRTIAAQIICGKTYAEIAADLNLSKDTVKNYAWEILVRVGCDSRLDLALRFTAVPCT
jgi:DNA-binding NarL/FixJ family response regulator